MESPIVFTEYGEIEGKFNSGWSGQTYYSFKGIPYAKPPIGNQRFKAPVPPDPWYNIKKCTEHGNRSVYRSQTGKIIGSEDCLYLNVYTKQLPPCGNQKLKAVMFWIHGGGFKNGSGNADLFGPDFLISEDVVLVTINYRLGLLGFFALEDISLNVPGNAGLKDMVLALKWVKNNISYFNGDPNNVTIFGESAGATAVHLLVVSPMAKGLFHKAIAQSGTAVSPWAYCVRRSFKFAEVIGANCNSEQEVLEFMLNAPAEKLVEAEEKVAILNDKLSFRVIGPIIENTNKDESFLPEDPEILLLSGNINPVPMIIGHNTADGMVYCTKMYLNRLVPMDMNIEDPIPRDMKLIKGTSLSLEVGNRIVKHFYGNETPSQEHKEIYTKLQTHINFSLMTRKAIRLQCKATNQPVFVYRFSFDSPCNLYKKFYGLNLKGAAHGDELTYLFQTSYPSKFGMNETKTIRRMVKLWANFAKYGNPTPNSDDYILNVQWEPITPNHFKHLDIGNELKMIDEEPDKEELLFWEELYAFVEKNVDFKSQI